MKICAKCGSHYEGKFCKPCKKLYLQEYRKNNKAKVYAVESAWRKANSDRVKATSDRWKAKNPTADRQYYLANTAKIRQRTKNWYEANKEKATEYKKEYYKRKPEVRTNGKAKRRNHIGTDRLPYGTVPAIYKRQGGKCACCGVELNGKFHVDHIMPLALGGRNIPENVQLLTAKCNQRKSAKHPDVWRAEITASLPEGVSSFSVCKP